MQSRESRYKHVTVSINCKGFIFQGRISHRPKSNGPHEPRLKLHGSKGYNYCDLIIYHSHEDTLGSGREYSQ